MYKKYPSFKLISTSIQIGYTLHLHTPMPSAYPHPPAYPTPYAYPLEDCRLRSIMYNLTTRGRQAPD